MTELKRHLAEAISRMEKEHKTQLSDLETRMKTLETDVQGCHDLQNELEGLLGKLEQLSNDWPS